LQVTGKSNVVAGALVVPFLAVAALSSTLNAQIAAKWHIVRPPFLAGLVILPIGIVRFPISFYSRVWLAFA
jgi:hypothetical protein